MEVKLQKTSKGLNFPSEELLENFIWRNLEPLFGIQRLAKQYYSNGHICDILAQDSNRGLVIIELKSCEDRYVTCQLTRYYDELTKSKPFLDIIDYSRPIRLIALSPGFHQENWLQKKYSRLKIEFIRYEIDEISSLFRIRDESQNILSELVIKIEEQKNESVAAAQPPQKLINFLSKSKHGNSEKESLLSIRKHILEACSQIVEVTHTNCITYGKRAKGRQNKCAEFYLSTKSNYYAGQASLFLYLPDPTWHASRLTVRRMHIFTSDFLTCKHLTPRVQGFRSPKQGGRLVTLKDFQLLTPNCEDATSTERWDIYQGVGKDGSISVMKLVNIAIQQWKKRMSL